MGSGKLIDYFIGERNLDLNFLFIYKVKLISQISISLIHLKFKKFLNFSIYRKNLLTSPLLTTIQCKRIEAAKYLIFRKANINLVGEVTFFLFFLCVFQLYISCN